MDVPASLRHRIELFKESGRVFRVPNELFAENSWIQVMLEQGMMPESYHQSADLMGDAELGGFLDAIRAQVEGMAKRLPSHQQYLQQYCRA